MVHDVSIYLGTKCNFNCSYCDRDYIKDNIGNQKMDPKNLGSIYRLLDEIDTTDLKMLSFHGGEPFVYVKQMDEILSKVDLDVVIFIQTNGSLISRNEKFLTKWKDRLRISISYDFSSQGINRTAFDIHAALELLKSLGISAQVQSVIPMDNSFVNSKTLSSILELSEKGLVDKVGLTLLRHIRGKDSFGMVLDSMTKSEMSDFFARYIIFIQTLVINNVNVFLDGIVDLSDITYRNYKKLSELIISPDGYLYPEYDFLDYKVESARVGEWLDKFEIYEYKDLEYRDDCKQCPNVGICGLKYLKHMYNVPSTPEDNCVLFYSLLKMTFLHIKKLQEAPLLQQIGLYGV